MHGHVALQESQGAGAHVIQRIPLRFRVGMFPLVLAVLHSNYSTPVTIPIKDCSEKGEHPNLKVLRV